MSDESKCPPPAPPQMTAVTRVGDGATGSDTIQLRRVVVLVDGPLDSDESLVLAEHALHSGACAGDKTTTKKVSEASKGLEDTTLVRVLAFDQAADRSWISLSIVRGASTSVLVEPVPSSMLLLDAIAARRRTTRISRRPLTRAVEAPPKATDKDLRTATVSYAMRTYPDVLAE